MIDDNVAFIRLRKRLSLHSAFVASFAALPAEINIGESKTYRMRLLGEEASCTSTVRSNDSFVRHASLVGGRLHYPFMHEHMGDPVDSFFLQFRRRESGLYVPLAEAIGEGLDVEVSASSPARFERMIQYFENCGGHVLSTSH